MSPAGANRRTDVQRMLDGIDRAVALAKSGPDSKDDEIVQSLRHVRDVLMMKACSGRHAVFEGPVAVTAADEAEARPSPRRVHLKVIEVTLKESAVVGAQIDVVRLAAQRRPMTGAERAQPMASRRAPPRSLRQRSDAPLPSALEPCNALHEQLLNANSNVSRTR